MLKFFSISDCFSFFFINTTESSAFERDATLLAQQARRRDKNEIEGVDRRQRGEKCDEQVQQ